MTIFLLSKGSLLGKPIVLSTGWRFIRWISLSTIWINVARLPKQNTRATNENISTKLFNKDWIILPDVVYSICAKFRHDFTSSNPTKHKARMSESFHNRFCLTNLFCKSEFSLTTSLRSKDEPLQMLLLLGSFLFRVEQEVGLINTYSSSPNWLWVNSPFPAHGILTQRPWGREK